MEPLFIGGVEIQRRVQTCTQPSGAPSAPARPAEFNFVVYVTNACNASCSFCSNIDNRLFKFDLEVFKRSFDELIAKAVVTQVTFTGGEPTLNAKAIMACIEYINQVSPTPCVIMTHGGFLDRIDPTKFVQISVSRHHWNHEDNERILGIKLKQDYLNVAFHDRIKLACNIIKGEVDSSEKMIKMLELSASLSVPIVGFVGLMQVNDFAKEAQLAVPTIEGPASITWQKWQREDVCSCARSVYVTSSGKMIRYYVRHNQQHAVNQGGLLVLKYNKIQPSYYPVVKV